MAGEAGETIHADFEFIDRLRVVEPVLNLQPDIVEES
jgi:hypothetical protein